MTMTSPVTRGTASTGWSGHWIAPEAPPQQDPLTSVMAPGEPAGFSRALYRRTFSISGVPEAAPARLTADSRYVLWVNGQVVGRGPARSQPLRQRYDDYDLGPYLVPGVNVIAVLVTYYGHATPFWMPAPGGGAIGRDAVLVFEAQLADEMLVSDAQWRSRRSGAWSLPAALPGHQGVPVEVFDARQLPSDWKDVGFDDSSWQSATTLAAGHIGSMGRSQPPTYPYGRLLPRGISHLTGDWVSPERVLDSSTRPRPGWEHDNPVARVLQVLDGPAGDPGPGELPATFTMGPGRSTTSASTSAGSWRASSRSTSMLRREPWWSCTTGSGRSSRAA